MRNRYNKPDLEEGFSLTATQVPLQAQHTVQSGDPGPYQSMLSKTAATSASPGQSKQVFNRHYKDITFDTLKERHDNFCFEKVLQTKNQIYDTMHFTGIVERPNNPSLVLFKKQAQQDKLAREYSNSKYQNMTDSVSFYDAFQR